MDTINLSPAQVGQALNEKIKQGQISLGQLQAEVDKLNKEGAGDFRIQSASGTGLYVRAYCTEGHHVWKEDYYGHQCTNCDQFFPYGGAPWDIHQSEL